MNAVVVVLAGLSIPFAQELPRAEQVQSLRVRTAYEVASCARTPANTVVVKLPTKRVQCLAWPWGPIPCEEVPKDQNAGQSGDLEAKLCAHEGGKDLREIAPELEPLLETLRPNRKVGFVGVEPVGDALSVTSDHGLSVASRLGGKWRMSGPLNESSLSASQHNVYVDEVIDAHTLTGKPGTLLVLVSEGSFGSQAGDTSTRLFVLVPDGDELVVQAHMVVGMAFIYKNPTRENPSGWASEGAVSLKPRVGDGELTLVVDKAKGARAEVETTEQLKALRAAAGVYELDGHRLVRKRP